MEADWSVEIGPGQPVIEVPWQDWVDLRSVEAASQVLRIPSAAEQPALAAALLALNAESSPWFTSKCDLWALEPGEVDPYEFDAADLAGSPLEGWACYLDLLARAPEPFMSFERNDRGQEAAARQLRETPGIPHARIDLVLRAAVAHELPGYGITAYVAGCGLTPESAVAAWQRALAELTRVLAAAGI